MPELSIAWSDWEFSLKTLIKHWKYVGISIRCTSTKPFCFARQPLWLRCVSSSKVSWNVLFDPLHDVTWLLMVHLPLCSGHHGFLHPSERQSTSKPSHQRRCTATEMRAGRTQAARHGKLLYNCSHHTELFFYSSLRQQSDKKEKSG